MKVSVRIASSLWPMADFANKSLLLEKQELKKKEKINRVKANITLPVEPPTPSDWSSADARAVDIGSSCVAMMSLPSRGVAVG
jgi:hypothetical protein